MSPGAYSFLADLILVVHVLFVAFVVLGFAVIWLGRLFHRSFVRNFYFRAAHLLAMGYVALQSAMGKICPLTIWEEELRLRAGAEAPYEGSFVQHWVHRVLFLDLNAATFAAIYVGFFLLFILTWWFVPPRAPAWMQKNGRA